jgi:uncharacterized RDD family membrane protein YckC
MVNDMAPPPTFLGRYAGFVTRLVAFVIDRFVIGLVMLLIAVSVEFVMNAFQINQFLFFEKIPAQVRVVVGFGIYLLLSVSYDIGFWLMAGQTLGKRVMGLRIVRTDGERLRLGNALRRVLGYVISGILFLGFLWILFDNRRQGFHDKLAGTLVVYSWPEDELKGTFVRDHVERIRYKHQQSGIPGGESQQE